MSRFWQRVPVAGSASIDRNIGGHAPRMPGVDANQWQSSILAALLTELEEPTRQARKRFVRVLIRKSVDSPLQPLQLLLLVLRMERGV